MKQLFICLLLTGPFQFSKAQTDSTKERKFRFDVSGGFFFQKSNYTGTKVQEASIPAYLQQRRPQEPGLANTWGLNNNSLATDNPLGHGASYLRFHSWYNITAGLDIYGSLEATNGGFSWGPYNTFNIAFLPRFNVKYYKAFTKSKIPVSVNARLGNFENFKNYEGLTMYNLDVQGLQAGLRYKKLHFSTTRIADLKGSIGLNIDGISDYKLSLEKVKVGKHLETDIQVGLQKLLSTPIGSYMAAASAGIYNRNMRAYAEGSYRFNENYSPSLNFAFVAGIMGNINTSKIDLDYTLEYRYYGGGFNYAFRQEQYTHYRKTDKAAGANFIGDQVYPISFVNRPFSQWAVFTEYNGKRWVDGYTAKVHFDYALCKYFKLTSEADFNLIAAEGEKAFLYPFFKGGIKVQAIKGTYLAATITNKTMNFDNYYTTYYLLNHPVFQFELRRDIKL